MKAPVRIVAGPVLAKLVTEDRDVKLLVNQVLSYTVEGSEFMNRGGWDGKASFYDFTNDTFPAGFYYRVVKALAKAGHRVMAGRMPAPEPLGPLDPVIDEFEEHPRYAYQREVYRKLITHHQIIARIATGGGKSRIARLCYRRIARPTLFLTTRGVLMHQMKDSFAGMGERVGVIGDGYYTPNETGMNVGMVQTIAPAIEVQDPVVEFERFEKNRAAAEAREIEEMRTRLSRENVNPLEIEKQCKLLANRLAMLRKDPNQLAKLIIERVEKHNAARGKWLELLKKFEFVILEEAHEASGTGYFEVLKACTRAHYRLALTATPDMKDSEEANMRLEACSGQVAISVTEKQLIESGILARPYFKFVTLDGVPSYTEQRIMSGQKVDYPVKLWKSTPWPAAYEIGVAKNPIRNAAIVSEALRAIQHGLSVMVLVQQRAHGRILSEMFVHKGVKVAYIFGDHDQAERTAALNALKTRKIDVLIGSTILDVGVDVPAVGMVIIGSAGKAEVAFRQRIGRGLREKKAGPNVALIVDFTDDLNNHLRGHARERRAYVDATPGFAENVVADFDYTALGFAKIAA